MLAEPYRGENAIVVNAGSEAGSREGRGDAPLPSVSGRR